MVLKSNQTVVSPEGVLKAREEHSFMVLDTVNIKCDIDKKTFGYSIELLNLMRMCSIANKMCSDFQSSFKIDIDIYQIAINNLVTQKSFSKDEIELYFKTEQVKEEFLNFSRSLASFEDEFYVPYEIDFIILGMDVELYDKLNKAEENEMHDNYGEIAYDVRNKKISIDEFFKKATALLYSSGVLKGIS